MAAILELNEIRATNNDSMVKNAVSAVTVERGNVVKLTTVASTGVYTGVAPVDVTADVLYMVSEPAVVTVNGWKGLTDDPRLFSVAAGTVYSVIQPAFGDEITLSADGIGGTKGANTFIVPANTQLKLQWAANTTGVKLAYELLETVTINVPSATFYSARVTGYKFRCVLAV